MEQRYSIFSLTTFAVLALVIAALIDEIGNRYPAPNVASDSELICSGGLAGRPNSGDREYCKSYTGPKHLQ
jgi:hypothetical protein